MSRSLGYVLMRREQRTDGSYRAVVQSWNLDRGRCYFTGLHYYTADLGVTTEYNGRRATRVTVAGRAFTVLLREPFSRSICAVAEDSAWWLVWVPVYHGWRLNSAMKAATGAFLGAFDRHYPAGDYLTWRGLIRTALGR